LGTFNAQLIVWFWCRNKKSGFEGSKQDMFINPYITFLQDNALEVPQALLELKHSYSENFKR
jgi:hypothetical protein